MPSKTKRKRVLTDLEDDSYSGETSDTEFSSRSERRKRRAANGMSNAATSSTRAPENKAQKRNLTDSEGTSNSGGTSDPDSCFKGRKRKRKTANVTSIATTSSRAPETESSQIVGFVSVEELDKFAQQMGLKKLTLDDLYNYDNLNDAYVGGQVLSQFSTGYGHLGIFIQDESPSQPSQSKHLMITVNDPLAEEMPSLGFDAKLFIHKADIMVDDTSAYSQDHGKCLVVTGKEARLWIVHKDVRDPMFFSRTSCGKRWWKRTKKRREKMQSKWSVDKGSLEPSNVRGSKTGRGSEEQTCSDGSKAGRGSEEQPRSVGSKAGHGSEEQTSAGCSKAGRGTEEQTTSGSKAGRGSEEQTRSGEDSVRQAVEGDPASQSSSSFPVNPDFPDSAFAREDPSSSSSSSSSGSSDVDSDTGWTRKYRTATQPSLRGYSYKKLADLRDGDKKQNVICVVKEFNPPTPSRGSDYYSLLTLVDESEPDMGLRAVFFNKDSEKLPQVQREGDIVCVHRIGAKTFGGRIQLEGGAYCSIIRFSGETGKKVKPWTGSLTFTLTATEREKVRELRRWARKRRVETQLCGLESVHPNANFDLLCQVVSVTVSKVPLCTVLSVWDGTPHMLKHRKITMEKNYDEGYPEIRDDAELSEESMGYCVDVVVHSKRCMHKTRNLCPGKLLYLQNVHCAVINETENVVEMRVCGKNGDSSDTGKASRITVLRKTDRLCRTLENQIARATTPITATPHRTQHLCTVADVAGYGGTFPAKFRCRVKVLTVNASSLEDLVVVFCSGCQMFQHLSYDMEMVDDGKCASPCPKCFSQHMTEVSSSAHSPGLPVSSCQFYFALTLMDASGELSVQVGHQQAMELFGGLKPNNFYQFQHLRLQLNDLLYRMTGGRNPFTPASGTVSRTNDAGKDIDGGDAGGTASSCRSTLGPQPWLECSILAVKDEDDIVQHCIFDTTLSI